ncbi:hypothetical protein CcCBS67573_g05622 [Chytriomyces confervae]|uniref:PX domain-containing protein n=1 Tax=Chytriomyces confervae TaxID=246404 RepID=A0A507FBZ5_9FUNG|nr:Vacuolar protein sorting-associated protein 5 [Chytriomyces hyalinus]TPX73100.1 hypothetical protein CcCBS67573_g05622 [Chytriomyces confervae]
MDYDDDLGSGVWGGPPISKTESAAAAFSAGGIGGLDETGSGLHPLQTLRLNDEEEDDFSRTSYGRHTPVFDPSVYDVNLGAQGSSPGGTGAWGDPTNGLASDPYVANYGADAYSKNYGVDTYSANYGAELASFNSSPFGNDSRAVNAPLLGGISSITTITPKPAVFDPLANLETSRNEEDENNAANEVPEAESKPLFEFEISVTDPQKVGHELISGHVVYKVVSWTNCPGYRNASFSVTRRYSDFLWLYNQLVERFPGVIVPPLPGKHVIGRFQEEFIEARRAGLERFIQKVSHQQLLQQDPDLRLFLESTSFSADKKEDRSSILGVFGGVSSGLNASSAVAASSANAGKVIDDAYLEKRRFQIEQHDEIQLKMLLKALENLMRQRRDLGNASNVFGDSLINLSKIEAGKEIGRNLMLVGEIQKRIKELHEKQSGVDLRHMASVVEEYIRIIGSVRVAFAGRMKMYSVWQAADLALKKKRENIERMRGNTGGGFRAEDATIGVNNLPELESQLSVARRNLKDVTDLLHAELARYDKERITDFTGAVQTVLRSFLETQKQIISLWESYYEASGQEKPSQ